MSTPDEQDLVEPECVPGDQNGHLITRIAQSPTSLLPATTFHLLDRLVLFSAVYVLLNLSFLNYSSYLYRRDFCYFVPNLRANMTCNFLLLNYLAISCSYTTEAKLPFSEYTRNGPKEKAKAVRENGFNDDMTGIDDRLTLKELLPYTKGLYNEQIDTWRAYEKDHQSLNPSHFHTFIL
ncbi:hypothetical protein BDZ45DRAFT_755127 [Acephala macrosclerotiorum]|nr:hypothetical protein BDZ45DRAFT_755127 [Acephala macrosclerotiorum]